MSPLPPTSGSRWIRTPGSTIGGASLTLINAGAPGPNELAFHAAIQSAQAHLTGASIADAPVPLSRS